MQLVGILENIDSQQIKIGLTVLIIFLYLILSKTLANLTFGYGKRQGISLSRVVYTTKYFRFVAFIACLLVLGIIWDVSFKGLSVYFLSFFTVAGIGLFASWSILSNMTAAVILFFYSPIRIGQTIKIMDGDNSVEGLVYDLTLFAIVIKNAEGQKVTYPNNVALQKGIIHIES